MTARLALLAALLGLVALAFPVAPLLAVQGRDPALAWTIVTELRIPRAVLALAIGGFLGLSGAAMQGLLRNPLASPDVTGASAGAALGAVIVAYSLNVMGTAALAAGAITGAALALAALLGLAGRGASTNRLVLAGVAISALAGAATNLALSVAPSPYAIYDILFWMLGSVADRSLVHVAIALPCIGVGGALILSGRRGLDALALGEEVAASLGHDVARLRLQIVAGTALGIGASVAVAGAIGFIGLIVPHLVRRRVRSPGASLVPSALAGAALLSTADLLVRVPVAGQELKLGVVTALIGAPFFLHLIVSERRA